MDKKPNPILLVLTAAVLALVAATAAPKPDSPKPAAGPTQGKATTAQATPGTTSPSNPAPPAAVPASPGSPAAAPSAASPAAAALSDIQATFGFIPRFLSDMPVSALPGTWEEMKSLQLNPKTALPAKAKELIGLGVAAQIPCMYCVQAHREFARAAGASEAEIGDAVAMSALTRHWSTYLNGIQLDPARFKQDLTRMTDHAKKMMQSKAPPAAPLAVTDGASALADIKQSLGFVPEFLQRFPEAGRAGAWKAMRDVEMNPNTALNGKFKTLVGLAVSSQIPCTYCIQADTEFSKVEGATEAERNEAIAMAALTRHMSTLLNGMRTDENQFASDLSRLVKNAQASRTTAPGTQPRTR